jgi:hypothetical protein
VVRICHKTGKRQIHRHGIQSVPGGKVNILRGHRIGHSKQKLYMYMCPIPNGFRDKAMGVIACIMETQDALRRTTLHVLTRTAKCIDVDDGIFENVLY